MGQDQSKRHLDAVGDEPVPECKRVKQYSTCIYSTSTLNQDDTLARTNSDNMGDAASPSWAAFRWSALAEGTPELVMRMAEYVDIGNDMTSLTTVIGPSLSRRVRHEWLHKNTNYLTHTLLSCGDNNPGDDKVMEKAKSKIEIWMRENPEWEDLRADCSHNNGAGVIVDSSTSTRSSVSMHARNDNDLFHETLLADDESFIARDMIFKSIRFGGRDILTFTGWTNRPDSSFLERVPIKEGEVLAAVGGLECTEESQLSDMVLEWSRETDADVTGPRLLFMRDPHRVFCSPYLAIKYGLVEVLKHMIESGSVSSDDKYSVQSPLVCNEHSEFDCPLIYLSLSESADNYCMEYLLSRDDIDLQVEATFRRESIRANVARLAILSKNIPIDRFRAFMMHPKVDPNDYAHIVGMTPLHYIISRENLLIERPVAKVKALLEAGADPLKVGYIGLSPIDYAKVSMRNEFMYLDRQGGRYLREIVALMEAAAMQVQETVELSG